jgi:hypothetical protein
MKLIYTLLSALALTADAFAPSHPNAMMSRSTSTSLSMAKYNTMEEILAKFPEEKPVLINFYDSSTEAEIKSDIVRAKTLLEERCTVVSIKQQDYPGEFSRHLHCSFQDNIYTYIYIYIYMTFSSQYFINNVFHDEEIAKLWDADKESPSMILFKDGKPVTRLYGESFYLDVVSKIGKFCRSPGEEHDEIKK